MIAITAIKELFSKSINEFKRANIEAPTLEVGVIICEVLKCDESFIFAHNDYVFTEKELETVKNMLEKRISGVPLQYLTGHQEFMSLNFNVDKDVLIPRQDTEILVEAVIDYVKKKNPYENLSSEINYKSKTLRILDIGAGSGCIGVSLAHYLKNVFVTEIDKSVAALENAKSNAVNNGVADKMEFVECDILECDYSENRFDVIVSNPPYIKASEIENLESQVRDFEPMQALLGGEDGLNFYRSIVKNAPKYIVPDGMLAFEVGFEQARDVKNLMMRRFDDIKIIKDLSGIERVVTGIAIPSRV